MVAALKKKRSFTLPVQDEEVSIFSATNYDQFVLDPRNRPVDWDHVQRLLDSVMLNNLLEDFPIVVEQTGRHYKVLDGQHRLEVAKLLEVPIYFKVSNNMTFSDVHGINGAHQSWSNENYLNRWIREGKLEYIRFNNFIDRFSHFGINFGMHLCMTGGARHVRDSFRNGTYVCNNIDFAQQLGEMSLSMKPFAEKFWAHKYFLVALRGLLSNPHYDHEVMLKKLEYLPNKMVKCPDSSSYIDMMLDIYNYKARLVVLTPDGILYKNGNSA